MTSTDASCCVSAGRRACDDRDACDSGDVCGDEDCEGVESVNERRTSGDSSASTVRVR